MLLLSFGCPTSETTDEYPPPLPLEAALTACTVDADCVAVELGCCDACNGGLAVAVNLDSESVVSAQFQEFCDPSVACTAMGCAPWVLSCPEGTCELERDTLP